MCCDFGLGTLWAFKNCTLKTRPTWGVAVDRAAVREITANPGKNKMMAGLASVIRLSSFISIVRAEKHLLLAI